MSAFLLPLFFALYAVCSADHKGKLAGFVVGLFIGLIGIFISSLFYTGIYANSAEFSMHSLHFFIVYFFIPSFSAFIILFLFSFFSRSVIIQSPSILFAAYTIHLFYGVQNFNSPVLTPLLMLIFLYAGLIFLFDFVLEFSLKTFKLPYKLVYLSAYIVFLLFSALAACCMGLWFFSYPPVFFLSGSAAIFICGVCLQAVSNLKRNVY